MLIVAEDVLGAQPFVNRPFQVRSVFDAQVLNWVRVQIQLSLEEARRLSKRIRTLEVTFLFKVLLHILRVGKVPVVVGNSLSNHESGWKLTRLKSLRQQLLFVSYYPAESYFSLVVGRQFRELSHCSFAIDVVFVNEDQDPGHCVLGQAQSSHRNELIVVRTGDLNYLMLIRNVWIVIPQVSLRRKWWMNVQIVIDVDSELRNATFRLSNRKCCDKAAHNKSH